VTIDQSPSNSATQLTYEHIVDRIIDLLRCAGAVQGNSSPTPWNAFLRLSSLIHDAYEIPSTTFTPMMRRLLFALGFAAQPQTVVGIGTYVGYTFSWLLRDRRDSESNPFPEMAVGMDVDESANQLARRNCSVLNHGTRLSFLDGDGITLLTRLETPIDLLYIDVDDPVVGKGGYRQVIETASSLLSPGALVLAHDACVPKFAADFAAYNGYVKRCEIFRDTWIFPVDDCGLSVTAVSNEKANTRHDRQG